MPMFKIATWNVNSLKVRLPQVLDWLAAAKPDVLALQETKLMDEKFPLADIQDAGYQVSFVGQKTYNGVATLSKHEFATLARSIPDYHDSQKRVLVTQHGSVIVLNLYVPNGAEVGSDKYHYKLEWFSKLHPFIKQLQAEYQQLIVLGDLNIAPHDEDVHDPEKWHGCVTVSELERNEFKTLLQHGLHDCFRLFEQQNKMYSWWDYRSLAFRLNNGLRIDHILASTTLSKSCKTCYIDKEPRRLARPSDHTPVVAEFSMP